MKFNELKPLFKYPGGKTRELKYLKEFFPSFNNYIEPFVGGGAVYWNIHAQNYIINDLSTELISIYKYTKTQDKIFIKYVRDISNIWENKNYYVFKVRDILKENLSQKNNDFNNNVNDINLLSDIEWLKNNNLNNEINKIIKRKVKSLKRLKVPITNFEENANGVLGSAIYTELRNVYNKVYFNENPQLKTSLFLFLREFSYSSMFRFNSKGEFNVPFGGNSYANKNFGIRLSQITSENVIKKLTHTSIKNRDFSKVIIDQENTFMFLDPPYDSAFNTYNKISFQNEDQKRLRDKLLELKKTKWLLVIKWTPFIEKLYKNKGLYFNYFDKNYSVNFKNRNDKKVSHLIITNYDTKNNVNSLF